MAIGDFVIPNRTVSAGNYVARPFSLPFVYGVHVATGGGNATVCWQNGRVTVTPSASVSAVSTDSGKHLAGRVSVPGESSPELSGVVLPFSSSASRTRRKLTNGPGSIEAED